MNKSKIKKRFKREFFSKTEIDVLVGKVESRKNVVWWSQWCDKQEANGVSDYS